MRSCEWRLRERSCQFIYSHSAGQLVKKQNRCLGMAERLTEVGHYDTHRCSVRIDSLASHDSGTWMCVVQEYESRFNIFANPEHRLHKFQLNVTSSARMMPRTAAANDSSLTTDAQGDDDDDNHNYNIILAILLTLATLVVLLALGFAFWRLSRKRDRLFLARHIKYLPQSVRFHDSEEKISITLPENVIGNEKALEKMGGIQYIGSRRVI